jgi:predicted transcriptional regulator
MPNQRAANIKVTTIAIDEKLIKQLDKLAKMSDRSRNKVIEIILREETPRYIQKAADSPLTI